MCLCALTFFLSLKITSFISKVKDQNNPPKPTKQNSQASALGTEVQCKKGSLATFLISNPLTSKIIFVTACWKF